LKSNLDRLALGLCLLLAACASKPDHFYTLSTLPDTARGALSTPPIHVRLTVTVPALVDRAEMVMNTADNGILILDHERWAVSLSDQVSQTLARDIERRRSDVLIGDRGFDQATSPPVTMKVDIVRMSALQGGRASIEAHWRIVDGSAGMDAIGSDLFEAPLNGGYASVAQAYSQTLSALAERLAGNLPLPVCASHWCRKAPTDLR
jgi:uncharacterized protein